MAGAMRKMGIYLGLVEDDDARAAYGRYDARQSDYDDRDDRHAGGRDRRDRYGYRDEPADGYADTDYPSQEFASEEVPVAELAPEPVLPRRSASPRRLDLAPAPSPSVGVGRPLGAAASGPLGAAGLAVREPVAAPLPPVVTAPPVKSYKITTLHPRTYNEARTIGERFRDGQPVIMNLSDMDDADAKRLVDFAAGLSFGLHGSIERVTAKVFLISPQGTDVTAEDKARIREGGFFNQS